MNGVSHIYRYYVTVYQDLIIWELYRINNGQFELVWEFIGLRYYNWNEINWEYMTNITCKKS